MGRATDESLDELASRMTAYRERAAAARRLAQAISDKRATSTRTTSLIEHAQEFEKKAEAIATEIVLLAHSECRQPIRARGY
jgi:uncharacterized phage protein gp47/JayE